MDVGLSADRRRSVAPLLIAAALAVAATACGGGVYHQVRPGDTLYRIGKAYGVSYAQLAKVKR